MACGPEIILRLCLRKGRCTSGRHRLQIAPSGLRRDGNQLVRGLDSVEGGPVPPLKTYGLLLFLTLRNNLVCTKF